MRNHLWVWPDRDSRRRSSSSTRSTVATTRSNEGSSDSATRRTLAPLPLVSVIVAVHNDAPHIGYAVESVLRQTVRDVELIVVDDGSDDETPALLAAVGDPRVTVLTNERQLGLAASLNRGLE